VKIADVYTNKYSLPRLLSVECQALLYAEPALSMRALARPSNASFNAFRVAKVSLGLYVWVGVLDVEVLVLVVVGTVEEVEMKTEETVMVVDVE